MDKLLNVAVGVLVRGKGAEKVVLVTRRPADTVLGGYWEFPGGKVEAGETPQACLVREFREEVGLSVTVGEALPTVEHAYPHGRVVLHAFWCAAVDGQMPRNLQVAEHRWVPTGELSTLRFPPANGPLVAAIVAGCNAD